MEPIKTAQRSHPSDAPRRPCESLATRQDPIRLFPNDYQAYPLVCLGYCLLALIYSYPLIMHITTHIGGAAGDGPRFLWNLWWFQQALCRGFDLFSCDWLFFPVGAELVFHTLTPLHGFLALPFVSPAALTILNNLFYLGGSVIAGLVFYQAGRDFGHRRQAAFIGGAVFAFSPYHSIRGYGHFNLASTYIISLAAWRLLRLIKRGTALDSLVLGVVFGAVIYVDFYYTVYVLLLACALVSYSPLIMNPHKLSFGFMHRLGTVLLWFGLGGLALVVVSGNLTEHGLKPLVSFGFRTPTNFVLTGMGLRLVDLIRQWCKLSAQPGKLRKLVVGLLGAAVVAAMVSLPLSSRIVKSAHSFDRIKSERFFCMFYSADLFSLFIPPPGHTASGGELARLIERPTTGLEQWVYPGLLVTIMAGLGFCLKRREPLVRLWFGVGLLAAVLAMGPVLHACGEAVHPADRSDPLRLPFSVIMELPLLGGIRVPSRFAVIISLGFGWVVSSVLSSLPPTNLRRKIILPILSSLVLLDLAMLPYPLQVIPDYSRLGQVLAESPKGFSILEVPLEASDGYRTVGKTNELQFVRQSYHRRPILGGHVSRASFRQFQYYETTPLTAALLYLQETKDQLPDADTSLINALQQEADDLGIGHAIVSYRKLRPHNVVIVKEFLEDVLGFRFLMHDADLIVFQNPRVGSGCPGKTVLDLTNPYEIHHNLTAYYHLTDSGVRLLTGGFKVMALLEPEPTGYQMSVAGELKSGEDYSLAVAINGHEMTEIAGPQAGESVVIDVRPGILVRGINRITLQPLRKPPLPYEVGSTGVRCSSRVTAYSSLHRRHKPPLIAINDRPVIQPDRGFNIVVLNPETAVVIDTLTYFSSTWDKCDEQLPQFFAAIPDGMIVIVVLWDDGSCRISHAGATYLQQLGGKEPLASWRAGSYVLIGVKGAAPGTALESVGLDEAFVETPDNGVSLQRLVIEPINP